MSGDSWLRGRSWFGSMALMILLTPCAHAGGLRRVDRRGQAAVTSVRPANLISRSTGTLGTFVPTPHIMVRGNGTAGGGYSPLGTFGDTTMSLYGPLSALRSTAAPVLTYTRG